MATEATALSLRLTRWRPDSIIVAKIKFKVESLKFKSVKEQSRDNEGPVLVERSPIPKTFEEESTLFRSIDASLSEAHVEVYAPVIYDSPAQRRKVLTTLDGPMSEILTRLPEKDGGTNEDT